MVEGKQERGEEKGRWEIEGEGEGEICLVMGEYREQRGESYESTKTSGIESLHRETAC